MPARDGATAKIRREVTSCADCYAWGLTHAQGVCLACYNFAATQFEHEVGDCGSCHRRVRLKKGHCRLCWHQAVLERPTGPNTPLAPHVRLVAAHQLFLAGMTRRVAAPKPAPRRRGEKGRPRKTAPPLAGAPRPAGTQLSLLDTAAARHYRYGRVDLRATAKPDNPWLRWALYLAHQDGEAHGWSPVMRRGVQRSLTMLLAEHQPGEHLLASIVEQSVRPGSTNAGVIIDLLDRMRLLTDDRVSTFDQWLGGKLEDIPDPIRTDVNDWVRMLRDGGPRRHPRSPTTAAAYLHAARPALLAWSQRYDHLREVTTGDIHE